MGEVVILAVEAGQTVVCESRVECSIGLWLRGIHIDCLVCQRGVDSNIRYAEGGLHRARWGDFVASIAAWSGDSILIAALWCVSPPFAIAIRRPCSTCW